MPGTRHQALGTALRWERWQQTPIAQRLLTPEARAAGYTVLYVAPPTREAFFLMTTLLLQHNALHRVLPELLEKPELLPHLAEGDAAWQAWQIWTRRLGAYFARLATGQPGTVPRVPPLYAMEDGHDTPGC